MRLLKDIKIFYILIASLLVGCGGSKLPAIQPDIITENVKYDTDDPAIWINKEDPSKSIIFGTDKDTDGAIFAFDLQGKIIQEKTIHGIERPNNIDLRYDFALNDSTTVDIIAFTERERQALRIYSVPDMKELDNGGFPVFADEENDAFKYPMGISLYKSPQDGSLYAIVGRKEGPLDNYLYQYKINTVNSKVSLELIRKFGKFSGKKEIEAIAVDDALGYVYYSDEGSCVRKYYADPEKGNEELACFGSTLFKDDIEGIAIATKSNGEGYLIVSDQQRGQFNLFDRKTNSFLRAINLNTKETDGCEVVTTPLNTMFKSGLFVAMNDDGTFYMYDLAKLE